jgi:hypothetical protein
VPVDDKFFEKVNVAQLSWYNMQMSLDEKEQFELYRDLAEHNAMFTNPEGVQRIREDRENTIAVPDEQFKQTVKDLFGRDLPEDLGEDKDIKEILDKNSKKEDNISQYLDMELDEIKFIPQ